MKPIARLGDLHSCPKKGCGAVIVQGLSTMDMNGKPIAYEMFKKIILLYFVFFTWNANAMNEYDLEVKIFTNHVVYDVLLNGLPVIKNRSFRDRSLNIPTMGYVRKGKNTLEFNYSVVRSENKKIVHDADESTYFILGLKIV